MWKLVKTIIGKTRRLHHVDSAGNDVEILFAGLCACGLGFPPRPWYTYHMKNGIVEALTAIRDNLAPETLEEYYVNFRPTRSSIEIPEGASSFSELEAHQYHEMAIQICKRSCIQIGERCYQLKANRFCIIPRGVRHRLQDVACEGDQANMLWISITGEIVRTGYTIYSDAGRSKLYGTDLYIPGNFIIGEICAEQEADGPGSAAAIASYVRAFLSLLLQKMSFDGESAGHSWTNNIVSELQEYIREHLHEPLPLQELSGYVSLSPSYLCKLFKQVTGETITGYIHNLRIARATEYLADPSLSLSEIAERLGFYDQFHFSKVFKAHTSMSPSKYRSALTPQGAKLSEKDVQSPTASDAPQTE